MPAKASATADDPKRNYMRVAIVGGKLQGVEALYLARKAGWETLLIDRKTDIPGIGLCDDAVICDITTVDHDARYFKGVDLIIPALEDQEALDALGEIAGAANIPFAFDAWSYALTSSKNRSNDLFSRLDLPIPATWPSGEFPMIVKPDEESGSHGVQIV